MRILFCTTHKPCPTHGGIERVTASVAEELTKACGWECLSAYAVEDNLRVNPCFKGAKPIGHVGRAMRVSRLVRRHDIDVVVSQSVMGLPWLVRPLLPKGVCVVHVCHSDPGWAARCLPRGFRGRLQELRGAEGAKERAKCLVKLVLGPVFYRLWYGFAYSLDARLSYRSADLTVLLSKGYEKGYLSFAHLSCAAKLRAIPNCLSFERFATREEVASKEKVVLIVARMHEGQKRISLALDAWKLVKKDPRAEGWRLDIIGFGNHLPVYQEKVTNDRIPDVSFLGRRDPLEYYLRSSIFLMTSVSEGWGLTLTESQQMGVVPVAFDSYAAVRDIIDDGRTGLLFPFGDVEGMAGGVLSLMGNRERREGMAMAAVEASKRFTSNRVGAMWRDLLVGLCAEEPLA